MLVASPNIRHPVPFARELTALDDISDGRFTLGVGAGSDGDYDSRVFGNRGRLAGRTRRFGEFVELLDALLTTDRVSWKGEFYEAWEARRAPGCLQQPGLPFVVAADGPRAMAVAARYGQGWITMGTRAALGLDEWWRSVAAAADRFGEVLADEGREQGEVRRYLQSDAAPVYALSSIECYRDFLARAEELGFTDVVAPWPRADGVFAGREDVLEDVAAQVLVNL
jgi:alkanesulfonate monooxygenase SsuD/methylene tetrahydromethanopterin reductase-like flavin-dependent oxidoreductase (luciferase family)